MMFVTYIKKMRNDIYAIIFYNLSLSFIFLLCSYLFSLSLYCFFLKKIVLKVVIICTNIIVQRKASWKILCETGFYVVWLFKMPLVESLYLFLFILLTGKFSPFSFFYSKSINHSCSYLHYGKFFLDKEYQGNYYHTSFLDICIMIDFLYLSLVHLKRVYSNKFFFSIF